MGDIVEGRPGDGGDGRDQTDQGGERDQNLAHSAKLRADPPRENHIPLMHREVCLFPLLRETLGFGLMEPMSETPDSHDLTGKMLIAMPGMGDPRFDRSVVFVCAHSSDGAMGLIVNKPAPSVRMDDLLDQLKIRKGAGSRGVMVHFGGPVEHGRGFVLHSADYRRNSSTLRLDPGFGMTATLDILEDIAQGQGPERRLLALGYAGWGPGQLESEIQKNGWLTCDGDPDIVFDRDNQGKWMAALGSIGVDPLMLSATAGRA